MFIQTEATADPAELKFLPGREVLAGGTLVLHKVDAARSPLAERLFATPEVSAVSLGKDWIGVTKISGDWRHLKPALLGAIMDYFTSGEPLLREVKGATAGGLSMTDSGDLLDRARDALSRVIDPELGYNILDLGLVYDVAVEDGGAVQVVMTTTSPGCPATNYLKQGAGDAVGGLPGVSAVTVTLTYEPRWTPEKMSRNAKAHFGIREESNW